MWKVLILFSFMNDHGQWVNVEKSTILHDPNKCPAFAQGVIDTKVMQTMMKKKHIIRSQFICSDAKQVDMSTDV